MILNSAMSKDVKMIANGWCGRYQNEDTRIQDVCTSHSETCPVSDIMGKGGIRFTRGDDSLPLEEGERENRSKRDCSSKLSGHCLFPE